MEDIYYRIYDIFADVRDAIADVADECIAFATSVVDRALCRLGWWVLDAAVYRYCTRCQSHTCHDDCPPGWARTIGQWLVGTNS